MVFYILNRNEKLEVVLSNDTAESSMLYKAIVKEQLNKMYTLEMEVSAISPEAQYLVEENYILFKDIFGEWQLYVIKEVTEIHGDEHTKDIYAEHASQELLDDFCNIEIQGKTDSVDLLLSNLLSDTRWQVGTVSAGVGSVISEKTLNKSVLEVIHILMAEYGFDVRFRFNVVGNQITNRYVDLLDSIGSDIGKRFEYNKDIEKVERKVSTADLKTAIYPVGKDGLTITDILWKTPDNPLSKPIGQAYLEDVQATAQWGYGITGSKRARFIHFENTEIEDASELISRAYSVLKDLAIPKTTYTMEVIDLFALTGDTSLSFESVKMGDIVVVVDNEFTPALIIRTEVIERSVDLLQPENTAVVLGNYIENLGDNGFSSIMEQVDKKIADINVNTSELGNGSYADIEKLNDQVFHEAQGYSYYKDTEGFWVYDSPIESNPSKVLALKGGKLGIGTWNAQTQKWDITTFIDGNSVNASLINAGTLSADRLDIETQGTLASVANKANNITVNAQIKTMQDQIDLKASQTDVDETVSDINGKITSTNQKITDITTRASGIEINVSSLKTRVSDTEMVTDNVNSNFTFDTSGLTIGKKDSPLTITISNSEMDFKDNGVIVAYINGQKMYIESLEVLTSLIVGVHNIEKYNNDITLLKWVGGS